MKIDSPDHCAKQFLAQSGEFRLGALTTESSHPVTRELSQTAERSTSEALELLFRVDADVVETYRRWAASGAPERIADVVYQAISTGHKVYFTGCGATGRLSILLEAIWRSYWQRSGGGNANPESLVYSIMAGGDYALIKSVEGFEDFTQFGAKQIKDLGVSEGDVVFAITEGGETSFVIGTAWQGVESGAKVHFVYCNPDEVLRTTVTRSREVIEDSRIEKINLTTGPMAIMGSTRMQATSIQFLAMVTILEEALSKFHTGAPLQEDPRDLRNTLVSSVEELYSSLLTPEFLQQLAGLTELEAETYRNGHKSTYFADFFGVDVLTDTTERSPTFCTPAFRKWDDQQASESWAYLILPYPNSRDAWQNLLKRSPRGLAWSDNEIESLVGPEKTARQSEIMRQIGPEEILKFRIGQDGLAHRPIEAGDLAVCVVHESELDSLLKEGGFYRSQIEDAAKRGASCAVIFLGTSEAISAAKDFLSSWEACTRFVLCPLPHSSLKLDAAARIGVKMLLNAHSTLVMVRLGRVQGNCMVAVVPSNLKLIDRSARYIQTLTGLNYEDACQLLFESIDYIKPRMQSGQAYPPAVELSVLRFKRQCSLEEAEQLLKR
ncbi:MAG TPA: hypothetical protein VGK34_02400 [Armatimonadota bacterium]|jgi:N-acetylmuramic acid 6-phosphate etherase